MRDVASGQAFGRVCYIDAELHRDAGHHMRPFREHYPDWATSIGLRQTHEEIRDAVSNPTR